MYIFLPPQEGGEEGRQNLRAEFFTFYLHALGRAGSGRGRVGTNGGEQSNVLHRLILPKKFALLLPGHIISTVLICMYVPRQQ